MIFKTARIALIATVVGVLPSEGSEASTPDGDPSNRLVALPTLDHNIERNGSGDWIQLAQAGNRPPRVRQTIPDPTFREGTDFTFSIPTATTFRDPDGDRLFYTVRENVDWMRADGTKLTGRPAAFDAPARVRVTATDDEGANATTTFRVRIAPRSLGANRRQSRNSRNNNGVSGSFDPSISSDGRFVAHVINTETEDGLFETIVVRDFTFQNFSRRGSNFTIAGPDAGQGVLSSPSISADGRVVAYVARTTQEQIPDVEIRVVRIADSEPLVPENKFVQAVERSGDPEDPQNLANPRVSLSAHGRIVAFEQDTDIVVVNIDTREELFISNARNPSLSRNGRVIAYEEVTDADQRNVLVATLDFVRMEVIDTVVGVDLNPEFGPSSNPVVSGDGRFVAFESDVSDLVPDDTNAARDIFVFNVREDTRHRVSVDAVGDQADADASNPSLSADGRLVAFDMELPIVDEFNVPLVDEFGGRTVVGQVLVRRINQGEARGQLRIASVDNDGDPGNFGEFGGSSLPALSGNGRFVTFQSSSTNLTPDARQNAGDTVFLVPAFPNIAPAVDFPIDPSDKTETQAALEPGVPRQGEIDPAFDADWYRIELIGGEPYRFELQADSSSATPLGDPFLELRDREGEPVVDDEGEPVDDDDSGGGLNALLNFTAPSTDIFFVVARGLNDETGDYVLSVVTPPPAVTVSR